MRTGICCLSYDQLNRLTGASASAGYQGNSLFCWSYDSFGNRLGQSGSNLPFANAATCQPASGANVSTTWAYYTLDGTANTADNGLNRLTGTDARGSAAILTYDDAGDVTNDGDNSYLYDAEGRICAVNTSFGMTQYVYDAAGARVAKGTISTWNCDQTTNGFAQTNQYILGPNGEQLTEEVVTGGTPAWKHTNVYAAGSLIATYENDGAGPHFRLTDWLGTMRAQTNYAGVLEETCASLPFGDTPTPCVSATEQFFTGKERDAESGLDYFGARYYGSNMGRWMSPDWSAKAQPVPYAKLDNPQSLNLYAYVFNSPLVHRDADGHIIDETGLDKNKAYQKWKKEYLSHDGAQAQWNKLNDNKDLTVHLSWDSKGTRSLTSGYQWDQSGKLTSVNVSLSSKTGDVSNSMNPFSGYVHGATITDPAQRHAYVIAHEFAHVEYAETATGHTSLDQSHADQAISDQMVKQYGGVVNALKDPIFQQANQRLLDSSYEREQGADQRAWDIVGPK